MPGSPGSRFAVETTCIGHTRAPSLGWVADRGVAQPGSALDWGSSGRRFKSCLPDQLSCLRNTGLLSYVQAGAFVGSAYNRARDTTWAVHYHHREYLQAHLSTREYNIA